MSSLCKPKPLISCTVFTGLRSTMAAATVRLPFTYGVGRKEDILGLSLRVVYGLPGRK